MRGAEEPEDSEWLSPSVLPFQTPNAQENGYSVHSNMDQRVEHGLKAHGYRQGH